MTSTAPDRRPTGVVLRKCGRREFLRSTTFLSVIACAATPLAAQDLDGQVRHHRWKLEFADALARDRAEATMESLREGASIAFQLVVLRPLETMQGERHAIWMTMSGDLISRLLGTVHCGPERDHRLRVFAFPNVREWCAGEEGPREWDWGMSGRYSHGASVLIEAWGNDALHPSVTYDFLPADEVQGPTTAKMLIRHDRQEAIVTFDLFGRPIEEVRLRNDSGLGELEPGDRTMFRSLVVQQKWSDRFPISALKPFIFALAFLHAWWRSVPQE